MKILETERLLLREVTPDDAEFILGLLNQPSFIEFIGDRGVRSVEQAREYIASRFTKSYADHGFGLYAVELKNGKGGANDFALANVRASAADGTLPTGRVSASDVAAPIGLCGFVRRDTLPKPDIGFAFLPQFGGKGYAVESARAMMEHGRDKLGLTRVLAITTLDNEASRRLLEKIGFKFDREIEMGDEILKLFSCEA